MILGVKCEGCRMWTRVTHGVLAYKIARDGPVGNYYCDECNANVTYRETRATIRFE